MSGKTSWREKALAAARDVLLAAAAALPVLWRLARMPHQPAADSAVALAALKTWYPFHYFPESWPASLMYTG